MCTLSTTTSSTPPDISLPIEIPALLMDKRTAEISIGITTSPQGESTMIAKVAASFVSLKMKEIQI
jgi:hypothetical protein